MTQPQELAAQIRELKREVDHRCDDDAAFSDGVNHGLELAAELVKKQAIDTATADLRRENAELTNERDEAHKYLRWFCSNLKWFTFMKTRGCHDYQVEKVAAMIGKQVPDVKDVGKV